MGKNSRLKISKRNMAELNATGVLISCVGKNQQSGLVFLCLMKALIIFLITCGTVIGFCEAFSLPYNRPLIVVFTAAVSVLMSLLYLNKKVFIIGYMIVMILYVVEIIRYYLYANSGFQAIVNTVREAYADYFNMEFVKSAEEFYENRYVTITIALMFILVFIIILLNITISRYMNLAETFFIAFFILEFALYIAYKPPIICLLMVMTGCVCIGVLQRGAWMRCAVTADSGKKYIFDRFFGRRMFTTRGDSKAVLMILAFSLLFSTAVCLASIGIYEGPAGETEEYSAKSTVDDYVQILVRNGIGGLFDRYDSKNGLMHGLLGGVSSVSPDFKTDIVVSFVPSGEGTVYLPGFKAAGYSGEHWYAPARISEASDELASNGDTTVYIYENTLFSHALDAFDDQIYAAITDENQNARMEITYLDNWFSGELAPYFSQKEKLFQVKEPAYTLATDESGRSIEGVGQTDGIGYVPLDSVDYFAENEKTAALFLPDEYRYYIENNCLEIPERLNDYFRTFFREHSELKTVKKQIASTAASSDSEINKLRLKACSEIEKMFLREYPYTLSPGKTPTNEDFVMYFLKTQKRGFCAHFASSAVMLLRYMEIPARYAEGYCIPYSLLQESAKKLSEVPEGWSVAENGFARNVYSVEVSDYYAHAWIEVYLEGIGFVPYEVTPPSFENVGAAGGLSGIGDFFQRLLSVDLGLGDITEGTLDFTGKFEMKEADTEVANPAAVFIPIMIVLGFAAVVWIAVLMIRYLLSVRKMKKMLADGDYAGLIYKRYMEFLVFLFSRKIISEKNILPMMLAKILENVCASYAKAGTGKPEPAADSEKIYEELTYAERTLYSDNAGTYEEYLEFSEWIIKLKKYMKSMRFVEKG